VFRQLFEESVDYCKYSYLILIIKESDIRVGAFRIFMNNLPPVGEARIRLGFLPIRALDGATRFLNIEFDRRGSHGKFKDSSI